MYSRNSCLFFRLRKIEEKKTQSNLRKHRETPKEVYSRTLCWIKRNRVKGATCKWQDSTSKSTLDKRENPTKKYIPDKRENPTEKHTLVNQNQKYTSTPSKQKSVLKKKQKSWNIPPVEANNKNSI